MAGDTISGAQKLCAEAGRRPAAARGASHRQTDPAALRVPREPGVQGGQHPPGSIQVGKLRQERGDDPKCFSDKGDGGWPLWK